MFFVISQVNAQTTIWSDDFSSYTAGTGVTSTGNIGDYPGGVSQWSLDVSGATLSATSDYIKTVSSAMEVQDTDGDVILTTQSIDISACTNIQFSMDISESGDHESTDYADVEYSIDGGAFSLIANWNARGSATHTLVGDKPNDGDWITETVSQTGLNGSTLVIRVTMNNNAGTESMQLDNMLVEGTCVGCTTPTSQATFTSFTAVNSTDFTINFGTGTGGNGRIVVVSDAVITSTPSSGTTYTANTVYGSGTDIGTNEFVVYDNTGTSVTVTGLSSSTTYYVAIFEYATGTASDPCYNSSLTGNTGNTTTACPEPGAPSSLTISNESETTMDLSWSGGGPNYLVVVHQTSAVTANPTDASAYTANAAYGSGDDIGTNEYVVYNSTGTSVTVTGLTGSTDYYFTVFSYDCSPEDYETGGASANSTTLAPSSCASIFSDDFGSGLGQWSNNTDWANNGGEMQHDFAVADGNSYNYADIGSQDLTASDYEWEFCMRNDSWDPSGSNDFAFWLVSDATNLLGGANGYAVGINQSGTSDEIMLYSVTGGTFTPIITLASASFNWDGSDDVCIRVTRTAAGLWELLYNPNGTGEASAGTISNTAYTSGQYIGPIFDFTSTRAKELWIDDVSVCATALCTGPTTQASFTSITSINSTDFTINFGAGTGGNGRIVVVGTSAIASTPTSGTTYTANTVFGSGTDMSGGSGEYVVYDGTGTSVTITGLTSNTTYYVAVFEYATGGATDPCYDASISGNTGNATTLCALASEPTTNASAVSFSNVSCTSLTVDWTSGNGANRIIVISTSAVAGTPTDGTDYTANSVYASGETIAAGEYVAYNGSGASVDITGLTNGATYYIAVFEYNGTTTDCDENYLTTSVATGSQLLTSTDPAANASAYVISDVACNGFLITWTSPGANDGSTVVMKSGSDVTTDPVDGTTYTGSTTFGSGTDIGASEFVIYTGSATSTWVYGLSPSTTYYINVFDYNGSGACINYRTSDEVSDNETTIACTNSPNITMALINSCDVAPCAEGDNEMVFLNSQDHMVSTSASDITLNYGSTSPASNTYADAFTTNASAITDMNADAGCTGVFIDGSTVDYIPPATPFLIVNSSICADAFDWSSICAAVSGNVYVLFSSDATWTSSGQFSNSPPAAGRYFRTTLGGATVDYFYDDNLPAGNGASALWGVGGGTATSFISDGCALPAVSLPISLLYFSGYRDNSTNFLNWSTASEINNDYFDVERSSEGYQFETIGMVYGNGTSTIQQDYSFIDESPKQNLNYYRLKQVDFDGNYSYSNTIVVKSELDDISIWHTENLLHISYSDKKEKITQVNIYNTIGQLIYSSNEIDNSLIKTDEIQQGIYLVQVKTENSIIIKKIKF